MIKRLFQSQPKLQSNNSLHFMAVIAAVVFWSISFVATKIAFTTFPPFTLGALRFILAAFLLGIVLALQQEFLWPSPRDLVRFIGSGILGITIYFAMENLGVKLATAADAAMIVASYPAMTMLLERVIYRNAVSKVRLFGAAIAIFGVYWIARESSQTGNEHRLLGDVLLAVTGIVWAFYNFVTRKVVHRYPAILITFYQTTAGALAFLPLAWIERSQWKTPTGNSLFALLYLGLFCSTIAFLLYAYGLKKLTSSSAVSLMNLVPVLGVIFALIFLHEPLSGFQFIGGIVVIAGIMLSVRQESKNRNQER